MAINVTPIPRLIDLAAPAFTLGTANAAGSAVTAVASDATLLAFDAVAPAAVAAAAVVGTSTVSSRRDHVHPGTTGAGTVVDEAITRFNGTGGSSLQGYSSLSPTISDAGIISLTSGALKFPATAISSSDVNTLDQYQEGAWTPFLTDDTGNDSEGQGYSQQEGTYIQVGRLVLFRFQMTLTSIGSLTGGQSARVGGLPFPAKAGLGVGGGMFAEGLAITAGNSVAYTLNGGASIMNIRVFSGTAGAAAMTVTQVSASGRFDFSGVYEA